MTGSLEGEQTEGGLTMEQAMSSVDEFGPLLNDDHDHDDQQHGRQCTHPG